MLAARLVEQRRVIQLQQAEPAGRQLWAPLFSVSPFVVAARRSWFFVLPFLVAFTTEPRQSRVSSLFVSQGKLFCVPVAFSLSTSIFHLLLCACGPWKPSRKQRTATLRSIFDEEVGGGSGHVPPSCPRSYRTHQGFKGVRPCHDELADSEKKSNAARTLAWSRRFMGDVLGCFHLVKYR